MKKIKSIKTSLKKNEINHKNKKKTMQGNIVAIHNVLKKNCIAKFSTSSIFKKIGKDNLKKTKKKEVNFRKKKTCKKKGGTKAKKKKHVGKATVRGGNTVAIHNVIFKKTTKLNSQPARYKKNKIDKDQFEKKKK